MMQTPADDWPFKPGQQVRVKPGPDWRADWQYPDLDLRVVQVGLCVSGGWQIIASENWPKDPGCDFDADDLEAVS